jgi:hypothetical protein
VATPATPGRAELVGALGDEHSCVGPPVVTGVGGVGAASGMWDLNGPSLESLQTQTPASARAASHAMDRDGRGRNDG